MGYNHLPSVKPNVRFQKEVEAVEAKVKGPLDVRLIINPCVRLRLTQ